MSKTKKDNLKNEEDLDKLSNTSEHGSEHESKSESEDSEEKQQDPPKRLFGDDTAKPFSTGLFSSAPSLFNKTAGEKSSSLFGGASLFSFGNMAGSSSFFAKTEKKEEDKSGSEDEGEDQNDLFQGSKSPDRDAYNPEKSKETNDNKEPSMYTKKFVKSVENLYIYSKKENKFISRGNGFLSVEYADHDDKRIGLVLCRNTLGKCILEGILNTKVKKFESYVKNFKHVASFSFVVKSNDNKFEVGHAKVPVSHRDINLN